MLAGAKQEGTSDVAYSRNQPSVLEDDREPQRQSGARCGARQTPNPKRIADSEAPQKSQRMATVGDAGVESVRPVIRPIHCASACDCARGRIEQSRFCCYGAEGGIRQGPSDV